MNKAFPSLRYWCRVRLNLKEVELRLAKPFGLLQCEHDYENVFEWFEASDDQGFSWNVSRKHDGNGQPSFDDYLIIRVAPIPEDSDAVGQKLSNALLSSVSVGEGEYDKGNSWTYVERKSFVPSA